MSTPQIPIRPIALADPAARAPSVAATPRRHWRELVGLALEADDLYGAAALYPYACGHDQERLGARLFNTRRDRLALATLSFAPAAVLARLAAVTHESSDTTLGVRLARNPSTPGRALEALAAHAGETDEAWRLWQLLARHANAPHALLAAIASRTEDLAVLRALCENVDVPADLLTQLEQRGIATLQRLLAIHLATDEETLTRLWNSTRANAVRAQVLRHPYCPDALLRSIPASVPEKRSVALHARTSAEVLTLLAREDDATVRRAAAVNPGTPAGALIALCFDAEPAVRRAVAARADVAPRVVDWLAGDADAWVRRSLARNPACPVEWLSRFVQDEESGVRRAASRHPRCPARLLALLATDDVAWVRAGVAYRDDLPRAVLNQLARDTDVDVLCGVARNPATSQARLARLAEHDVPDVRRAVILNRQATRRVLLPLRDEGYPLHRVLVFEHPNLTDADRWRMRLDPDSEARMRIFGYFGRTLAPQTSPATRLAHRNITAHDLQQHPVHDPTNMMEPR
ncbi:hypothetical protein B0G84_7454 [Paraburkholderia sp. BL8N3]|nr:hypothetical protein [Paraburkholderia sp. BL8N3]TCK35440.1 hypothetical protein B0G84_7454 [Paraburkholderia sp. BL8N3]